MKKEYKIDFFQNKWNSIYISSEVGAQTRRNNPSKTTKYLKKKLINMHRVAYLCLTLPFSFATKWKLYYLFSYKRFCYEYL